MKLTRIEDNQILWGIIIIDIIIIALAIYMTKWQNNPSWLWLLVIAGLTGKVHKKRIRVYESKPPKSKIETKDIPSRTIIEVDEQ